MLDFINDIYAFILAQELRYKIVLSFLVILLIASIVMTVIVLRERARRIYVERQRQRIIQRVEPVLLEVIFNEGDANDLKASIQKLKKAIAGARSETNREILRSLVLKYHRTFGGAADQKLSQVYRETNLKDQNLKELNDKEWHVKAKAITELGEMGIRETLFEILQFTDNRNMHVRDEAQYAAVRMGGVKALNFLKDTKQPISEWQQIRLLDECLKFGVEAFQDLEIWLKSKNVSVVLFGLKVAHHLSLYRVKDEVINLLYHKNVRVQIKTVEACVNLLLRDSLKNMHEIYELGRDLTLKKEIIRAFGELGGAEEMKFLKDIIANSKEYDLILEASKALRNMGEEQELRRFSRELEGSSLSIVNHTLDDRI